MWSLSFDEIERVKEELKGRRAALRARYDDEVQALEADLANIETLELAATLFVAKYREAEAEIASLVPGDIPAVEPTAPRNWRALLDRHPVAAQEEPN